MPDPQESIQLLFIGVAPTNVECKSKGNHFYSDDGDNLRRELFEILSKSPFDLKWNGKTKKQKDDEFHKKFYFVHAAKVRPKIDGELSPSLKVIEFCANRHLLREIEILQPKGICILSINNVGALDKEIFGFNINADFPNKVSLKGKDVDWEGWMVKSPQPRFNRRNRERAEETIKRLFGEIENAGLTVGL